MSYSNCLIERAGNPLVLDTSAVINLYACGKAEEILDALPHETFVTRIAADELRTDNEEARQELAFLQELLSSARVRILDLSENGFNSFASLVSGSRSLGDGEAATLAVALEENYVPVIDEKKARRRLRELAPAASAATTIDILLHDDVEKAIGTGGCADAVYSALRGASMSVLLDQRDMVVNLIGADRAIQCRSLPGYKRLRQEIQETQHQSAG